MSVKLVYKDGAETREYALEEGETRVGRRPSSDLCFPDSSVSKDHARFVRKGERLTVEDLGSRNGTLVNGDLIEGPAELKKGDLVQIGRYKLKLELEEETGKAAPPAPAAGEAPKPAALGELCVVDGSGKGTTFALDDRTRTIGAKGANDICLEGEGISRYHAEVRFEGGAFFLKDLGSRNGTFVNAQPVVEWKLAPRDQVQIGTVRLEFRVPGQGFSLAGGIGSLDPKAIWANPNVRKGVAALIVALAILQWGGFLGGGGSGKARGGVPGGPGGGAAGGSQPGGANVAELVTQGLRDLAEGRADAAEDAFRKLGQALPDSKVAAILQKVADRWRDKKRIFNFKWAEANDLLKDLYAARSEELGVKPGESLPGGREDAILEFAKLALKEFEREVRCSEQFKRSAALEGEGDKADKEGRGTDAIAVFEEALKLLDGIPPESVFSVHTKRRQDELRKRLRDALEKLGDRVTQGDRPDWQGGVQVYTRGREISREREATARLSEKIERCWREFEAEKLYNDGYDRITKGEFERAREALAKVPDGSALSGDAKSLVLWIDNQLKYKEAKRLYYSGEGGRATRLLQEILDEKGLAENVKVDVRKKKTQIEAVVRLYEEAQPAYDKRDFAKAIPLFEQILKEETDAENDYHKRAQQMLDHARESMVGDVEGKYKEGLRALEADNYEEALRVWRELKQRGGSSDYVRQAQAEVKKRSEKLVRYAKYEIQFKFDQARFPIARAIYDLVIEFLDPKDPTRKEAEEARKSLG